MPKYDYIAKKYDFYVLNAICLLGNGTSWINYIIGKLRFLKIILLNLILLMLLIHLKNRNIPILNDRHTITLFYKEYLYYL